MKIIGKLLIACGVIGVLGSMFYLWLFVIYYAKAGALGHLFIGFLKQLIISFALFALGDLTIRFKNNEVAIARLLEHSDSKGYYK